MSVALDLARVRAPAGDETFRGEYLRALRMIERLHRLDDRSFRAGCLGRAEKLNRSRK